MRASHTHDTFENRTVNLRDVENLPFLKQYVVILLVVVKC